MKTNTASAIPSTSTPSPTSLIHQIAVSGHTVSAFQEGSRAWVSVRSICEALGVDTSGQVRKLAKKNWAVLRVDFQHIAADGKMRQMILIDVECLPMWLSTIEAGRVSADLGDRLLVLQQRAAKAVKEHFFGSERIVTAKADGDIAEGAAVVHTGPYSVAQVKPVVLVTARQHLVAQAEALVAQAKAIDSQRGEIAELRDMVAAIHQRQAAAAVHLLAAPGAERPPAIPLRRWIDAVVGELSDKIGKDQHDTWRVVYRGLKLHYGTDAYARARNASKKAGHEVKKIDCLESSGLLSEVYATAKELLRQAGEGGLVDGPVMTASPALVSRQR